MERLLHYAWQYRLYTSLVVEGDESIEIIDPGILNEDAGPDFFNAKIRLSGLVIAGNIEIHRKASDWVKHGHHTDAAYDNVILHIVEESDSIIYRRADRLPLLTARIAVPNRLKIRAQAILESGASPTCLERIHCLSRTDICGWMDALLVERLQRKVADIECIHRVSTAGDWNETTYILLARHLGFGINNDALERLARHLPLRYLQKHRDHILQLEAMLLGSAGLLDQDERQQRTETPTDAYLEALRSEYLFLSAKFGLHSLPAHLFRKHRIRPASFPHIRLAQLAAILHADERLFHRFLATESLTDLSCIFAVAPSDYWLSHYSFGCTHDKCIKGIPDSQSRNILVANVICPLLMAYGSIHKESAYTKRAMDILHQLPPESNKITRLYAHTTLKPQSMAESQALLQLNSHYCKGRRCFDCRIGCRVLRNDSQ